MRWIFTEYVRSLKPGHEPDSQSFANLWKTLQGALFTEMGKRSLLHLSPAQLGVYGRESWSENGAFEELVSDCYSFIFLDRLPALQAQLEVKENIEGLVFRNIRNFLYEAQKKHDPIGFKTYTALSQAVSELIGGGVLRILEGGARLHRDSVLGFAGLARADGNVPADLKANLEDRAKLWSDDLLPELVTARGRKSDEVNRRLAERISDLAEEGVAVFRFQDVLSAFRSAVRIRWETFWLPQGRETALEKVDGETVRRIGVVKPGTEAETAESFEKLCLHVSRAVEEYEGPVKARHDLERFWTHLRHLARDEGLEKLPSRRELGRQLGLSRHQLTTFFALVERFITRFQASSA